MGIRSTCPGLTAIPRIAFFTLLLMPEPALAINYLKGCSFTRASLPLLLADADTTAQQAAPPSSLPSPKQVPTASPELLRPPQEQELKPLGDVLRALSEPDKSAGALQSLLIGRPFSFDRYAILLDDVRSILVFIQAEELRNRLEKSDAVNSDMRAWLEPRLNIMETCGPSRFANRGGNSAFKSSVEIIRKWQSELQPLLFSTSFNQDIGATPTGQNTESSQ